jgi:YidC/Oxa1 family membrane protein insertase
MMLYAIPILSQLETLMKHVLTWFHTSLNLPWAWAIVATTVVVRMLLVPLTVKQIHSMQNLQRFAPQMKEIQKKYKNDKQKQNEELMKFYRENNINPAASCLPMLAQLPVFIALYYSLKTFSKHPPSGSMSWLHFVPNITWHTTSFWGGYVLLVVYVASQMASTFFMSATADRTQRYLFMIMPLVFVFVIARFPAGLVLYWVTTNLWTVGQGLITRRLMPRPAAPEKRSSRTAPKAEPTDTEPSDESDGGSGNGATPKGPAPKPQPSAKAGPPRKVRRKKGAGRR